MTATTRRYHRGLVPAPNLDHLKQLARARHPHLPRGLLGAPPPASWDSRTQGVVGPVKEQGDCGSCWNFSGTGMAEVALAKAGVLAADGSQALSEAYSLDCCKNGGCDGDDNVTVLQWARQTGLPLSSDYGPYRATPGQCAYRPGMALYRIADWGFADGGHGEGVTDPDLIKGAIMTYGCVGCAVAASQTWDSYRGGIHQGTSVDVNHDVILVGWQDDDSVRSGGYWIMRNSWGASWGEEGYMRIGYGSDQIGTEAVWAVAAAGPHPPQPQPPQPGPTPHAPLFTVTLSRPVPRGAPLVLRAPVAIPAGRYGWTPAPGGAAGATPDVEADHEGGHEDA